MTRGVLVCLLVAGCQSVVAFEEIVEAGEQCGDGIDNDGDGLTDCDDASCGTVPACNGCGNAIVEAGEDCDDGNAIPDDGCSPDCTLDAGCGNGIVEPDEACDDGNGDDTDGCPSTCQIAACGDGFVHAVVEQCDDANADDTDECPTTCQTAACGDAFVRADTEQCDDGNDIANDGCATCTIERCGDGIRQTGPAVSAIDFEWLASSCTEPRDIVFRVRGAVALAVPGDAGTCTCEPTGGFSKVTVTDPAVLAGVLDGPNEVSVDFSGANHFLAWALVTVHAGAVATPIVVYEGAPGLALARTPSACSTGFDENVAAQMVTAAVSVFEACDDGNLIDDDGCSNECRVNP